MMIAGKYRASELDWLEPVGQPHFFQLHSSPLDSRSFPEIPPSMMKSYLRW
jgi:hypothetical protein